MKIKPLFKKSASVVALALSVTGTMVIVALSGMQSAQAGTSNASTNATATISSSCQIAAQNLNFGALVLPLSSQSTSTNMTVMCSKKATYTIGLAYGGVYGQGGQSSTIALTSGGKVTGGSACYYGSYYEYQYGSPYCASSITVTSTVYAYGKMIGAAKGDTVGYSIQVPNNPGQIWNAGNSTYSSTGTGVSQTIPVVGTLVPGQSGSLYPTPDSYLDTVTATINF
jgi:spore coat protein U-like protein